MSFPKSGEGDARLSHHQMCSLSCDECGKDPGPRGTEPLLGMSKVTVPHRNCGHICNPCLYSTQALLSYLELRFQSHAIFKRLHSHTDSHSDTADRQHGSEEKVCSVSLPPSPVPYLFYFRLLFWAVF